MKEVMHQMSLKQLENIAKYEARYSVSIYIPMYRTGKEQNEGLSQAHLKSCIKKSAKYLLEKGMDAREVEDYLKPVSELLTDYQLWRNPSDGMALF